MSFDPSPMHPAPSPAAAAPTAPQAIVFHDPTRRVSSRLLVVAIALGIASVLAFVWAVVAVVNMANGGSVWEMPLAVALSFGLFSLGVVAMVIGFVLMASARRRFGDVLTAAGYPVEVSAARLYHGSTAPTPLGYWLTSRRERRPDGTWLIVEPVVGQPIAR